MNSVRILLVDDEAMERAGMRFLLSRHYTDIEVFEASSGDQAMRVLQAQPIEILLTDIRMSFVDGLVLTRLAREKYPDLVISICSAYGEFEYARCAMKYGVNTYMLKPIDPNDFYREMDALIAQVRAGIQRRNMDFARDLQEGIWKIRHTGAVTARFRALLETRGQDADCFTAVIALVRFPRPFFCIDDYADEMTELFENMAHATWVLDEKSALVLGLTNKDPNVFASNASDAILERFDEHAVVCAKRAIGARQTNDVCSDMEDRAAGQTDEKMHNMMTADDTDAVACVIRSIQTRYSEDLTLEELAKSVYMTPNYLGYLFKKQTGETPIHYLMQYRLERVARLLENSDKKVVEIMMETGYNNPSYLSSVFKAKYGVTPSAYRKAARGIDDGND